MEYLELSLIWVKAMMKEEQVSWLAMPRIGAGLGGLDWDREIFPVLEDLFGMEEMRIEVWTKKVIETYENH